MFAEQVNEDLQGLILDKCKNYNTVGVLGVSFKPTSPVTIGSPSKILIESLLADNKTVNTYDKLQETHTNLDLNTVECKSAQDCIDKSEIVVIMHPDKDFAKLDYNNTQLVDLWGIKEQR